MAVALTHTQPRPSDPPAVPEEPKARLPLFAAYPSLEEIPWTSLSDYPSPVQRLEKSGRALHHPHLWIKRDDLLGTVYGGNKVRKLEFILGEARRRGFERIIVVGGIGSHHVLASALYAKSLGLDVTAILFPQPATAYVRDVLLALFSLGVDCQLTRSRAWMLPHVLMEYFHRQVVRVDKYPLVVYPGGSSPLGCLGYVNAAFEIKRQTETGDLPPPATLYVPLGSGGTMAGLVVGFALAQLSCKVIGVRVVERSMCNRFVVASLAQRTLEYMRTFDPVFGQTKITLDMVHVEGGYLGGGYGHPTPEAQEAIRFAKEHEKLKLEPTYSGKTFAAFMKLAPSEKGVPVLFWDTYNSKSIQSLIQLKVKDLPWKFRRLLSVETPPR
ncbi:MAG: pyridoxal-phosphate dependent enzyme [Nitrospirae bacterium]|nr:pyridoxal-phosphate dependent enzyme [Nitrospirota bacterium]